MLHEITCSAFAVPFFFVVPLCYILRFYTCLLMIKKLLYFSRLFLKYRMCLLFSFRSRLLQNSCSLCYFQLYCNVSNDLRKSFLATLSSTRCDTSCTFSTMQKLCPFAFDFILENKKKLPRAKFGEHGGYGTTVVLSVENFPVS